jgi:methylthioribose-1-phosphate isomerase
LVESIEVLRVRGAPALGAAREIGEHGAALLADGDTVMTHCNAVVGADRVVLDGGEAFDDQGVVFNKIGTYKHAVLADRHDVPFVVAAPHSTVDTERSADEVEIEQRDPGELREIYRRSRPSASGSSGNLRFP